MHRLWLLRAALVLVAVHVSPRAANAQGPTPAPVAAVLTGVAAINSGNLNAMAALIADNVTLEVVPGQPTGGLRVGGREAVLAVLRQAVSSGLQARVAGQHGVAGDRVTLAVRITDTALRSRSQAFQAILEVTVVDGRAVTLVVREVTPIPLALFEALPAGTTGVGLPRTGDGTSAPLPATAGPAGVAGLLGAALVATLLRRNRRLARPA